MATVRLEEVYVPTVEAPPGRLVATRLHNQKSRGLQAIAKPCLHFAEVILRTALECKKKARQATAMVLIKLNFIGKSIVNFLKKDFLKKEGVPLKGFMIYKKSRGMGKMIKNAT